MKLRVIGALGALLSLVACSAGDVDRESEGTSADELRQHGCETIDAPNHDAANLQKYEAYRTRLRNEFIAVSAGDEPGTNLPASSRQGTTLRWGDTTILVGQYLGMLATEYKLYEGRRPADALTTLRELHYALKALDRLDRRAESFFRASGASVLADRNGFFVRDDVAADFLVHFPLAGGVTSVETGTTNPYGGRAGYGATEMSQDQVWHLLVGLALVKQLVDFDGVVDGMHVRPRAHAKEITNRILGYMRAHDDWRTQNPVLSSYVLRGGDWDARAVFSYGFATAGDWILGKDAPSDVAYPTLQNASSHGAEFGFRMSRVFKGDNYGQRALATVGSINYYIGPFDWGGPLWKLEHETLSNDVFKYEQFPLVYVLLHGGTTRLSPQIYGGLLNAAPVGGPFNHGDGTNSCAWSSDSRLVWPESNGSTNPANYGEFNGIDYLFLHNLYQLVFNRPSLDALYASP